MIEVGPTKRTPSNYYEALEWWLKKADEYPFHAMAPTSIRPELVPGDHASVGQMPRIGWRKWGFKTEAERDQFCAQFGGQRDPR